MSKDKDCPICNGNRITGEKDILALCQECNEMMMNPQGLIKNDNGKTYKILHSKGEYLLLENLSWDGIGHDKYLVIYDLRPDGKSWQHGTYFETLEEAQTYFDEK